MRKPRNHALEYQRRIARAMAGGFSRTQARGHPRAGETFISKPQSSKPVKPPKASKEAFALIDSKRSEERAIKAMRKGASLKDAAASEGISQEKLRRYLKENTQASYKGRRWQIVDDRARQFPFYSDERLVTAWLKSSELSDAGKFMHAVKTFLAFGNEKVLKPFEGQGVRDIKGKFYPFETDPNVLYELDNAGELSFPEIYKIAA
ncbi:MAG: hypothetical protein WBX25_37350 [Rhodomicrobium sp.]